MADMTRAEFHAKKLLRYGRDGMEERYGCPYSTLRDWAHYRVPWKAWPIAHARANPDDPGWAQYLASVKAANQGITKLAGEYEKAITPLGRAAS